MKAHPLTFFLNDALAVANDAWTADAVQGAVVIHIGTAIIKGRVVWIATDGEAFSILRLGDLDNELCEAPQHIVTSHVTRMYYYRSGA